MPSLPFRSLGFQWSSFHRYTKRHLNFYRIHLLLFTFTPLILSAVFYASNGKYHISYVDALFNCVSAMTVTGLATVDLSELTAWQQVILFIQMCIGSPVTVSWFIVYIRRYFFAKKFQHVVQAQLEKDGIARAETAVDASIPQTFPQRLAAHFRRRPTRSVRAVTTDGPSRTNSSSETSDPKAQRARRASLIKKLRTDMIRRMDDAPKLVNPSGWISEGAPAQQRLPRTPPASPAEERENHVFFPGQPEVTSPEDEEKARQLGMGNVDVPPSPTHRIGRVHMQSFALAPVSEEGPMPKRTWSPRSRRLSDPGTTPSATPVIASVPMSRFNTIHVGGVEHDVSDKVKPLGIDLPRTQTVEFAALTRPRGRAASNARSTAYAGRGRSGSMDRSAYGGRSLERITSDDRRSTRRGSIYPQPSVSMTMHSGHTERRTKHRGYGGFPMPHEIFASLFARFFPNLHRRLTRTVTIPLTTTLTTHAGDRQSSHTAGARVVPYISFDAIVGRNSAFPLLTNEQLEELGGVEYRALNALLFIVAGYHLGIQIFMLVIIAPYISQHRWASAFVPPALHRHLATPWFSVFQVASAYTNTGMSLVDQSMVPFQKAYGMIFPMVFLVLAGNTCFPIFLRLMIWLISKCVPKSSRLNETLHFLLDHPRRCFIYLFPSHQTWFLATMVVALTFTDWFFFLVLDIGNPAIEEVKLGTRVAIGLLQAVAVRAAGFGSVALSALAPGVKVLYILMMYVSVYPIAMSVRSTNVYEEQSLGIFEEDEESDDEEDFEPTGRRIHVWSRYLTMHARRQLSFDMWWLGLALFLLCIIERDGLDDVENASWFNIFTIMFELVSAYGTVGLSLGVATANYSFSGALKPLSKLIICLVMLRGRHRGLPVAIDRAVMLPSEFKKQDQVVDETHSTYSNFPRTRTRASSAYPGSAYAPGSQNELPLGEKSFPLGHTSTVQPSMMPEKPLPHTSTIPAGIPVDKTLVDDDFRTTH